MIAAIWDALVELTPFILKIGGLILGTGFVLWWIEANERADRQWERYFRDLRRGRWDP